MYVLIKIVYQIMINVSYVIIKEYVNKEYVYVMKNILINNVNLHKMNALNNTVVVQENVILLIIQLCANVII